MSKSCLAFPPLPTSTTYDLRARPAAWPSPPFAETREGLTVSRGRGRLEAVGVAAAGRADVRRWQRRAVAAAGSGG